MDIPIESSLNEIGLNKSEIKVYLTLLKIGPSSTGPIINNSRTANSKIYEVLDKLIEKGLIGFFTNKGVKYYKAASPIMILEYLKNKKINLEKQEKEISSILPYLQSLEKKQVNKNESVIYTGERGVKTGFNDLLSNVKKGDELHIMGVHDFGKEFLPLALYFQKRRSEKKIKAKFLVNEGAKKIVKKFQEYPPVEIKYMKKGVLTSAIFIISKDRVIINIAKELTLFVIKSKEVAQSFEVYFEILWKQSTNNFIH